MGKLRRDKVWTWRCQWSIVTMAAMALVVYNAVANMWLLYPPSCPIHTTPPPSDPPTCEPCIDTVPNAALDDDPISRLDLRLGRWDGSRSFRLFDYAAVGELYPEVSSNRRVCLATQSSIERLHELLRIAAHWSGPISVAVFVAGDELRLLRAFATWLFRCQPDIYSRIALHVTMSSERPGLHGAMPIWARDCEAKPLPPGERRADTVAWRARNPYPQNHLRNLARKNCQTPHVFLVDVDIVPSKGMAEALDKFLASAPSCPLCAYVVPTYELDRRVANFPANKSELVRLSRRKLAIPFHRKVFIYNQYASNFSKWEASGGNETLETHVSHNVTNFELLYEPFYVAPDTVPAHDERFVGYGFTRNTQMVSNYKRKSKRGEWTEQNLARAMEEANRTSVRAAAKKYNVPFSTLLRHHKKQSCTKYLGRFRPVFTVEEEIALKNHLKGMDDLFYGLTPHDFKKNVGEFAKKLGKSDRFPKGCAGKDWLAGFRKRHTSIVLRTPEPTSLARARGFDRPQVDRFYDLLDELIARYSLDPTQIYNMVASEEDSVPPAGYTNLTTVDMQSSPSDILKSICPIPNAVGQKVTQRKRKSQKAEILTSTPVKQQQKEKFTKAEKRNVKKKQKRICHLTKGKNHPHLKAINSLLSVIPHSPVIITAHFAKKNMSIPPLGTGYNAPSAKSGRTKRVLLISG